MAKKHKNQPKRITNRRASFDYELGDSLTVGIVLSGAETKNLRRGHGILRGAYVTVKDDELWLINADITSSQGVPIQDNERTRPRKLLAKRREIEKLIQAKNQGKTLIPTEILTNGRFIKLKLSVGQGKKKYDKRQAIKKRDTDRQLKNLVANQGRR